VEAAFFDLDKTVIARASIAAFGRPFYRGGLISRPTVMRALASQFLFMHLGASEQKLNKIRESVLVLTRGWDQAKVQEIVRETLDVVVEPIIYAEALDLIALHQMAGRKVVLISASPSEIVGPMADYLGVDDWIASRAVVDGEGKYTGEMAFYAYGPYKAEAIKAVALDLGINLAKSFAYSDSYTDAPMLETVGNPVAVNPDRVLARLAREKGWAVSQFSNPVRLRDRMPVPRTPVSAIATGAAVAATGAGLLLWRHGKRPRILG
jgi:HAD superfamily hydrolase (TIGR01490 family)